MDALVIAFGPVFATALALQQLIELIDPAIEYFTKDDEKRKKLILNLLSLVVGLVLSFMLGLRVLLALGLATFPWLDSLVTGLIISGGTEAINSIMKFLGYTKEKQKAEAARARQGLTDAQLDEVP